MKHIFLFLATLMTASQFAVCQITINSGDLFQIGTGLLMAVDSGNSAINYGGPGSNQLWDFSSLQMKQTDSVKIIDPSGFMLGQVLPGDRVMTYGTDSFGLFITSSNLGLTFEGIATPDLLIKNDPPKKELTYPATFGQALSGGTSAVTQFYVGINMGGMMIDSLRITTTTIYDMSIDAWGVLQMPARSYNVLRVNELQYVYDTIDYYESSLGWLPALDTYSDTMRVVKFISDAENLPVATVYDFEDDGNSDQVDWIVASPVSNISDGVYGQNISFYPNPARDFTEIYARGIDEAEVSVVDLRGHTVLRESYHGEKLRLDLSDLKPGIYMIKFFTSREQYTQKLIVK